MSQTTIDGITDAVEAEEVKHAQSVRSVYVYEAPVRLWHWVNALAITVLCISGYFIGSPLPTLAGEASDHFLMGYIRFAHFAAGYIMAIGFVGRAYWAWKGNHHAKELFDPRVFVQKAYWQSLLGMLKWYAFIAPRPNQFVGHNPLARFMMFWLFLVVGFFMIFTGMALYGEGAQAGHITHTLFTSWILPIFGNAQDMHTWHHLGLWVMVIFVIAHVYAAIREDIMGRQSIVSTMISGHRTFKD